jgi:predicted esterase
VRERHLEVPRTARYHVLGPEPRDPAAVELWIVLHGYGQLARRFLRRFAAIDDGSRAIVAPEALARFYLDPPRERVGRPDAPIGATWMTREDREAEIADYVRYLDRLLESVADGGRSQPLTILGFSQGVATACRWVATGAASPSRLILWSGALPPELFPLSVDSALRLPALTVVAGDTDEYATPRVRTAQESVLREASLEFEVVTHPGGHEIDPDTLRRLAGR